MPADLTPEQQMDRVLSQIREYAREQSLTPAQIALTFEAGVAARSVLFDSDDERKAA